MMADAAEVIWMEWPRHVQTGSPVARLVPDNEKICAGRNLAEALAKTKLSEAEATAWHRDLQTARKTLKAPADKWR